MTFWATLYFAGKVVITLGPPGGLAECQELAAIMIADTNTAYIQQPDVFVDTPFPTNKFTVECESTRLPPHADYAATSDKT
jgi:hypothetical protein